MLPVAIAPAIEHIGDILAIGSATNKDYLKKHGLHRTMLGDGLATTAASLLGGPPNTTYSEVTGAVMLTKAFNPRIMTWAAMTAIVLNLILSKEQAALLNNTKVIKYLLILFSAKQLQQGQFLA
ncbi:hypothetical protein ND16A_2689 [Thalassotalea sp. ND16A]|nr:hypothetical protein ND16A_2689 [Thalassotalea sp. ND16A]